MAKDTATPAGNDHLERPGRALSPGVLSLFLALLSWAGPLAAHEVVPPKPIEQPSPVWPGDPLPHDLVVPMVVTVDTEGRVEKVALEAQVEPRLDAAAVAAVERWRFEPARDDTGPVRARIRVIVRFEGKPSLPARPDDGDHVDEPHLVDKVVEVTVKSAPRARSAGQVTRGRDVIGATLKQSGGELLKAVPGLAVTQHSGAGKAHQIYFRGFDAVHGQDLEIVVGGLPINEVSNVHGQGYADLNFVIPEVVDQIEALPAAFDPQQGDFAVAGSLRFRLGLPEEGLMAKGSYGRFDTRRVFLGYRPAGERGEETFAAFEHWGTNGFGPARGAQRTNVMGQVKLPLAERWTGRLLGSFHAGRFDSAGVVLQSDLNRAAFDRFTSYDPDQGGNTTRAALLTELSYEDDDWEAKLAPFVMRRTLRLQFNFTGALVDPVGGDNAIQRHDYTELGLRGSLRRQLPLFSSSDALEVGVFARHDIIDQSHVPTAGGPAFVDASVRATDLAGYADLSLRPWSRLVLRGGVRIDGLFFGVEDRLADDTGDRAAAGVHVGPKVTADVAILPELHALASYGKGFRSPQARSLADGETTPFTDLHAWEVGLRYQLEPRLSLSAAAYASLLSDDLVFNETTSRNEPVPATLRVGGSVDLQHRIDDLFVHAFGVSYTRASFRASDTRFAEGDLVPFVPQLILRSDIAVTPVLTEALGRSLRGHLGAGVDYLFRRPLPFGEIGSDILLFDASAGLRFGEVELRVDALNLFSAAYNDAEFVYASSFGSPSLIPRRHASVGAPLTVLGTLGLYL